MINYCLNLDSKLLTQIAQIAPMVTMDFFKIIITRRACTTSFIQIGLKKVSPLNFDEFFFSSSWAL